MDIPLPQYQSMGQMANEALQRAGQNQLLQQKNQFYAPLTQSTIDYKNALTSKVPSEILLNQATASRAPFENALNAANTAMLNAKTPYEAALMQQQVNALKLANDKSAATNPFAAQFIQSQIAEQNARARLYGMGGSGGGAPGKAELMYQNTVRQENPELSEEQLQEAINNGRQGQYTLSDGTPFKFSPTAQSNLDIVNKYGTDVGQRKQQRAAQTIRGQLQIADSLMPSVVKFSGIPGIFSRGGNAIASGLGLYKNPDYLNYLYFTQTLLPEMTAGAIAISGSNSSDMQKLLQIKALNPVGATIPPDQAMEYYKFIKRVLENSASSTARSPSAIQNTSRGTQAASSPSSGEAHVYDPTGVLHTIPANKLEQFLADPEAKGWRRANG